MFGCNKSLSNEIEEYFGAQVETLQLSICRLLEHFQVKSPKNSNKMSETEAKDVTTEQPTAEDLKGVKRAAEVRLLHFVNTILIWLYKSGKNAGSHT